MSNMWKDIEKERPEDCQRVLVWDNYWNEAKIFTYNDYYKCWEDEYEYLMQCDEYELELDAVLVEEPDKLRVRYWQPLPERPKSE